MKSEIKSQRGTRDVLPEESHKWFALQNILEKVIKSFNFKKISTPIFEDARLFNRSVGKDTDVVVKEMYTFTDKGGRFLALKPEGTASVVRSVIENSLFNKQLPLKLYYFTPCYRYEKPQFGRQREFHQFGIELFGSLLPLVDSQVIFCAWSIFKKLNLEVDLNINSMGCKECGKKYTEVLRKFFLLKKNELCEICIERFKKNPIRILDCKNKKCKNIAKNAPSILEFLCEECENHFEKVKNNLNIFKISYKINSKIARGLDYYNRTVFEFISKNGSAVCGGGRYDNLVKLMGGPDLPSVGFGIGFERLLIELDSQHVVLPEYKNCELYIANVNDKTKDFVIKLFKEIKDFDILCEYDLMGRNLKSQMKYADKINAKFALVIGENEVQKLLGVIKNLNTKKTFSVSLKPKEIAKIIKGKISEL